MNRLFLTAALIVSTAGGAAAEGKVKTKTPAQAVAALVRFTPPKGWNLVEYANAEGVDPVLRFEDLSDVVQIRVFGAPGSDYATPQEFMTGPAATEQGAAPSAAGTVIVAGKKLELYRLRFPIAISDPHHPSPVKSPLGTEIFCVLPLKDGRFAMLAYRRETPAPDMNRKGERAWQAFLKTVKPR